MVHLYHPHRQSKLSPSTYSGCCTSSCCSRCVQRALSEACAAIIPDCRLFLCSHISRSMAPLARSRSLLQSSLCEQLPQDRTLGFNTRNIVWEIVQEIIVCNQITCQADYSVTPLRRLLNSGPCSDPHPSRSSRNNPFMSYFDSALPPRQIMSYQPPALLQARTLPYSHHSRVSRRGC